MNRARIDDDDVGLVRLGDHLHAGLLQMADHDFAIDEVLAQPSEMRLTLIMQL